MTEITIIIGTLTEFRPLCTLWHARQIVLVKEIALVAFHTEISQPMPAYNSMSAARSQNTSSHTPETSCFLHKLTLPPCILRSKISFEIQLHFVFSWICYFHMKNQTAGFEIFSVLFVVNHSQGDLSPLTSIPSLCFGLFERNASNSNYGFPRRGSVTFYVRRTVLADTAGYVNSRF